MARSLDSLLMFLFGFRERVTRSTYATTGFTLAVVKYLVDTAVLWRATHVLWKPWNYLYPPMFDDADILHGLSPALIAFLFLWTIAFLWIGASMTIRRAVDANWSPWVGILFFIPVVNYAVMLLLCVAPTVPNNRWSAAVMVEAGELRFRSIVFGVLAAVIVGAAGLVINVFFEDSYGTSLFVATPVVLGIASGYVFNRHGIQRWSDTMWVVTLGVFLVGGTFLALALEGVLCLIMAIPLALPLALIGAAFGRMLAEHQGTRLGGATVCGLMIPLATAVDHAHTRTTPEPTYLAMGRASPPRLRRHRATSAAPRMEPVSDRLRAAHQRLLPLSPRRVPAHGTPRRPYPTGRTHLVPAGRTPARLLAGHQRGDHLPNSSESPG